MSPEREVAFQANLFKRFKGFNKFKKSNKPTINTKHQTTNTKLNFPKRPFNHFLPAWFFTIHQNACSVYLSGYPGKEKKAAN